MVDLGTMFAWAVLTLGGYNVNIGARGIMMPFVARFLAPGQWKTATVVQKRRIVSSLTEIVHHVCMVAIALPILWDRYAQWSAERFACTHVLRYDGLFLGPNILYFWHLSYCASLLSYYYDAWKNESEVEEYALRTFRDKSHLELLRFREGPGYEQLLVALPVRQPGHLRTLLRYGLSFVLMNHSLLHPCMRPAGVLIIGMCEASEIFHKLWFIGRWMKSETLTSVAFLCFSVIFFCTRFVVLPAEFARFLMNPNNHLTTFGYVIGLLLMVLLVCNVLDLFYGVNPFVLTVPSETGNPAVPVIAAANVSSPDDADIVISIEAFTEAVALYKAAQAGGIDVTMEELLPRCSQDALQQRLERRRERDARLRLLQATKETKSVLRTIVEITIVGVVTSAIVSFWLSASSDGPY